MRVEAQVPDRAHAAETHRQIAHRNAVAGSTGGEKAFDVASFSRDCLANLRWKQSGDDTNQTDGSETEHSEHQHADKQQAVLAERRQQLRQQHDDASADQWAEDAIGAPEHDDQKEQNRLKERK